MLDGTSGDWSPDVCSSDLPKTPKPLSLELKFDCIIKKEMLEINESKAKS
jgi:hypothetical protein